MPVQVYAKDESRFRVVANFTSQDPTKTDDTRTITIENPRTDLTMNDVIQLQQAGMSVLVGDRDGDPFSGFSSPEIIDVHTVWAVYERPSS